MRAIDNHVRETAEELAPRPSGDFDGDTRRGALEALLKKDEAERKAAAEKRPGIFSRLGSAITW